MLKAYSDIFSTDVYEHKFGLVEKLLLLLELDYKSCCVSNTLKRCLQRLVGICHICMMFYCLLLLQ